MSYDKDYDDFATFEEKLAETIENIHGAGSANKLSVTLINDRFYYLTKMMESLFGSIAFGFASDKIESLILKLVAVAFEEGYKLAENERRDAEYKSAMKSQASVLKAILDMTGKPNMTNKDVALAVSLASNGEENAVDLVTSANSD